MEYLELTTGVKFPPSDTVLHAYLHFEALTTHEYNYSCANCGDHPSVVIMDLHKKGVFNLSGMNLSTAVIESFQVKFMFIFVVCICFHFVLPNILK